MKVIAICVLALFGVTYWFDSSKTTPTTREGVLSPVRTAFQTAREGSKEYVDGVKAKYEEKHELANLNFQETVERSFEHQKLLRDAQNTVTLAQTSVAEVDSWRQTVEPLLTNRKGRTLGRSEILVTTFWKVYARERPDPELAAFISGQVNPSARQAYQAHDGSVRLSDR